MGKEDAELFLKRFSNAMKSVIDDDNLYYEWMQGIENVVVYGQTSGVDDNPHDEDKEKLPHEVFKAGSEVAERILIISHVGISVIFAIKNLFASFSLIASTDKQGMPIARFGKN